MRRALSCLALAGCNAVFGLDEAVPLAGGDAPTCASGWRWRVPIDIDNVTATKLTDYQVPIVLDTASPIIAGRMRPDSGDLRFTLADGETTIGHFVERDVATSGTLVWIKAPFLPPGRTRVYALYGNRSATTVSFTDDVFIHDIIANGGFESAGIWTVTPPPEGASRWSIAWPAARFATEGGASLHMNLERDSGSEVPMVMAVSQDVVFPPGSAYKVRFDVQVVAASNGDWPVAFRLTMPNVPAGAHWRLVPGRSENVTGIHYGQETGAIDPVATTLSIVVRLESDRGGYAKANFDHVKVRKFVHPEPIVTVGAEAPLCP